MTFTKEQYYILFLAVISFILLVSIFKWINYLSINKYIVENFQSDNSNQNNSNQNNSTQNNSTQNNSNTHTVDLPLTTSYSCKNFCGPTSRCAVTGQQCFTDIDCPGCQPQNSKSTKQPDITGDNAAGKLTFNITPQYSSLTTDMGTKALTFLSKKNSKTPSPAFGVNTWRDDFDSTQKLFYRRYKPPSGLENMPSYPPRYSVTGDFIEDGPLASNAVLK